MTAGTAVPAEPSPVLAERTAAPDTMLATRQASGPIDPRELLVLLGLLIVAAALRLPSLAARGTWDGDQGHDMLVLRTLVQDGIVPLLGPPTSIGDVHHGAWYYYLLSPAAFLTGGDSPLAVVTVIALAGVAAVGVVWWLARSMAGPFAGIAAGLLIATSAAAIDESTFIWNPNLIALSSAIALAAAWRAWSGGRGGWWVVSAVGLAITMQCHVLGVALLPIVGIPFVIDTRRRPLGGEALAALVVLGISVAPLAVHEITNDWSELHAAIDYATAGRAGGDVALPIRFGIIGLRVVSWPLIGLITDGFVLAVAMTCLIIGVVIWLWRTGTLPADAILGRWFGLGLLWATAFLTVAAPSLASVVPGLPNDHYHAFADPMVFVLAGAGVAAASRVGVSGRRARADGVGAGGQAGGGGQVGPVGLTDGGMGVGRGGGHVETGSGGRTDGGGVGQVGVGGVGVGRYEWRRPSGMVAIVVVVGLVAWNLAHLPPWVNPDGGYPAGLAAGERVDATLSAAGVSGDAVVLIRSLPDFKSTEAMAYPLAVIGRAFVAETPKGHAPGGAPPADADGSGGLIVLCDDRFAEAIGAKCGGSAEDAAVAAHLDGWAPGPLLYRFEAAPDRWVSVYGPELDR